MAKTATDFLRASARRQLEDMTKEELVEMMLAMVGPGVDFSMHPLLDGIYLPLQERAVMEHLLKFGQTWIVTNESLLETMNHYKGLRDYPLGGRLKSVICHIRGKIASTGITIVTHRGLGYSVKINGVGAVSSPWARADAVAH